MLAQHLSLQCFNTFPTVFEVQIACLFEPISRIRGSAADGHPVQGADG